MLIELNELELRYAALRVRDGGRTARMRASLAADGQQSAVSVIAHSDAGQQRFVLIDGYLRVQATRVLARDVIEAVVLPLAEADALITAHRLEEVGRRSALEDGWLLEELIARHGLSQQELSKRLSRSHSWVCRRLALVHLVPELAQGKVDLSHRGLRRAFREAQRGFQTVTEAHDGGVSCSTCTRARRPCASRRRATECGRLRRR